MDQGKKGLTWLRFQNEYDLCWWDNVNDLIREVLDIWSAVYDNFSQWRAYPAQRRMLYFVVPGMLNTAPVPQRDTMPLKQHLYWESCSSKVHFSGDPAQYTKSSPVLHAPPKVMSMPNLPLHPSHIHPVGLSPATVGQSPQFVIVISWCGFKKRIILLNPF